MQYKERYSDSVVAVTLYHENRYALYQVEVDGKVRWSHMVSLHWNDNRYKECFFAATEQAMFARKKVLHERIT